MHLLRPQLRVSPCQIPREKLGLIEATPELPPPVQGDGYEHIGYGKGRRAGQPQLGQEGGQALVACVLPAPYQACEGGVINKGCQHAVEVEAGLLAGDAQVLASSCPPRQWQCAARAGVDVALQGALTVSAQRDIALNDLLAELTRERKQPVKESAAQHCQPMVPFRLT